MCEQRLRLDSHFKPSTMASCRNDLIFKSGLPCCIAEFVSSLRRPDCTGLLSGYPLVRMFCRSWWKSKLLKHFLPLGALDLLEWGFNCARLTHWLLVTFGRRRAWFKETAGHHTHTQGA